MNLATLAPTAQRAALAFAGEVRGRGRNDTDRFTVHAFWDALDATGGFIVPERYGKNGTVRGEYADVPKRLLRLHGKPNLDEITDAVNAALYQEMTTSDVLAWFVANPNRPGFEQDPTRSGYGYTKAEVIALRSLLKLRINLATAEGLLMEALSWVDAKQTVSMTQYAAKKQRRRRNRREGYCLECCTRPARSGLKTCQPCSDARVARRRRALGKTA